MASLATYDAALVAFVIATLLVPFMRNVTAPKTAPADLH